MRGSRFAVDEGSVYSLNLDFGPQEQKGVQGFRIRHSPARRNTLIGNPGALKNNFWFPGFKVSRSRNLGCFH